MFKFLNFLFLCELIISYDMYCMCSILYLKNIGVNANRILLMLSIFNSLDSYVKYIVYKDLIKNGKEKNC